MGERELPYLDPGPGAGGPDAVVVDIGGDVGALVVYTTERCLGMEVDLTAAGEGRSHDLHTMVRRRRVVGRDVFAGLFPELREGRYTLWGAGGPLGDVEVHGGAVSEVHAGDLRAGFNS